MGAGLAGDGDLHAADGRIVAGVLQGDAAVGERLDDALIEEKEGDAAAANQHPRAVAQEPRRAVPVAVAPRGSG